MNGLGLRLDGRRVTVRISVRQIDGWMDGWTLDIHLSTAYAVV